MNDKCKECPWKNNVTDCIGTTCEVHEKEPLCHFIEEVREMEDSLFEAQWALDID